jgi:hypothetical protein
MQRSKQRDFDLASLTAVQTATFLVPEAMEAMMSV